MKKVAIVLVILVIVVLAPVVWFSMMTAPVSIEDEVVDVEIPYGSSVDDIIDILKENDLIKDKLAFKIYSKINNVSGLQSGQYQLNKNMNVIDIIEMLKTGKMYKETYKITFVEGIPVDATEKTSIISTITSKSTNTREEVLAVINDSSYMDTLIQKYWFLSEDIKNKDIYYDLEGYLYPATYEFSSNSISVQTILETMLDKMEEVLEPYRSQIESSQYSVHQIITLASMVERESYHEKDMSGVSGVFHNRLNSGMSLGSDVTTYYAVKVDVGIRDLTTQDLNKQNPYNTRGPNMEGKLPVGPISNVSESAIKAALEPRVSDDLFFVSDKNGDIYFTKSTSEHNQIIEDLKSRGLWFEF